MIQKKKKRNKNQFYRKALLTVLVLSLVLTLVPAGAVFAQEESALAAEELSEGVIAEGVCGTHETDPARWQLTEDGSLTISGTGDLKAFKSKESVPWNAYRDLIKKVVVKKGITRIKDYAFQDCINLKKVSLGSTVLAIGTSCFENTPITSITMPKKLKRVYPYAFRYSQLKSVDFTDTNLQYLDEGAFADCYALKTVILNDLVKSLLHTFAWDNSLEEVRVGSAVTTLVGTFRGCSSLKTVNLPEGITALGFGVFDGCSSLKELVLPNTLINIDDQVFVSCGFETIILPSKLENIGDDAFFGSALKTITIPASVKRIGVHAFPSGAGVTTNASMTKMSDGSMRRTDLVITLKPTMKISQSAARKMFKLINNLRTGDNAWYWNSTNTKKIVQKDLKALKYDYGLEKIAIQRAAEIALNFSHIRPDGSSCFSLVMTDDNGNPISGSGENIASGYKTYEKAMEGFEESSYYYDEQAHRRNMLSANYVSVGIGHVYYNGTHYWVQEFGESRTKTAKTAAQVETKEVPVITVSDSNQINSILISAETKKLGIGMSVTPQKADVRVRFVAGTYSGETASKKVEWKKSYDTSIVTIENGKLVGQKAGTTKIGGSICGQTVKAKVTVLETPSVSELKRSTKGVKVYWKAVTGASQYRVLRKAGSGSWKRIAVTTSLSYLDKSVEKGTTYRYSVRCLNKEGTAYESGVDKIGKKITY